MAGAGRRPLRVLRFFCALLLAAHGSLSATDGHAQGSDLVSLINVHRSAPQTCEGKRTAAVGPLAPNAVLERVRLSASSDLQAVLNAAGYQAAHAQAIVVTGPRNAAAALGFFKSKYCRELMSAQFADIGISRHASTWRVVLAQPLLAADLGGWREVGGEVLQLTNSARAIPRSCGEQRFGAAPALTWDERLAGAAHAHSVDMARRNDFSHSGRGGEKVDARARREGYAWRGIGENIATGQGSAKRVVDGWLASPSHCSNIMNAKFAEMGAAYALNPDSRTVIYWTQVFGTRR